MLPRLDDLVPLLLVIITSSVTILVFTPYYGRYLERRGRVVNDVHKKNPRKVPSPAGPVIVLALVIGELVVWYQYHSILALAIIAVLLIAFLVGLVDDFIVLGGMLKPGLLVIAALPLVAAQLVDPVVYKSNLYLPILGPTSAHFTIYTILVLASLPIVSNAFNMMDSFNGEIAGFALISGSAILVAILLRSYAISKYSVAHLAVALPLVAVSAAFYVFNRYPSRIFDGDSGSLPMGAMYASLAVVGGVEVAAVVAIIPAILNSFYILSSVRGLIEHKKIRARPTYLGEDGLLYATIDPSAPTTLTRLLLLDGPLSETDVVKGILMLATFALFLSVLTSGLTWLV
jgi:UDP-N-acetylglucosamine--dolichyl-phosphate N-acetylglucosaminephosphotransferase